MAAGVPEGVVAGVPDGIGVVAGVTKGVGVAAGVPEGVASGVAAGVAAGVAGLAGSSVLHLFTFPKVMRAFSTWKSGISAGQRGHGSHLSL